MSVPFETVFSVELIVCCGIVFAAAIVQMSSGMGFGMLASPLIALVKPEIVPVSVMLVGLVVALSGTWRERANISMVELRLGIGGRVVGSLLALLLLLRVTSLDGFFIIFGIVMLVAVCMTASGLRLEFNNRNLLGLSVVSGLMGTITAVGAPPMAIIYHDRAPGIVRPTLNAFFAAGCILGLASLGMSGWVQASDFVFAAFLLPAMLAGIVCSRMFMNISALWLSRILLSLSAAASIMLVLKGLY